MQLSDLAHIKASYRVAEGDCAARILGMWF
jgi:hypothetical protein